MADTPAYAILGATRPPWFFDTAPADPPPTSTSASTPAPWNGAATTLAQYEAVSMPQTPDGSMLLGYCNVSPFNSAGKLAWTSAASAPVMLLAPALAMAPSVFAHDWHGNNLTITNISVATATPISVAAYGPGLGSVPVPLPVGPPGVLLALSQAAQGATTGRWMQLGFRQSNGDPAVFGIIGGPAGADGTNAYVIALNSAAGETGPNTGTPAPPGYYATSAGNSWSYELNWPDGLLYVVYFGAAHVVDQIGAKTGGAGLTGSAELEQRPTVTLIQL